METFDILKIAANALNDKKAMQLEAIRIDEISDIADYFVICTATSNAHIRALADEVEEKLKEAGVEPGHIEGRASDWLLLDYGTVVIHIFGRQSREFYSLEHMWQDGEQVDLTQILTSALEE
ncbi:MAG: ribosome silencing factor [Clostridia bacterium]|nr:ribosome silencing factor [Clostridia bacterium]